MVQLTQLGVCCSWQRPELHVAVVPTVLRGCAHKVSVRSASRLLGLHCRIVAAVVDDVRNSGEDSVRQGQWKVAVCDSVWASVATRRTLLLYLPCL